MENLNFNITKSIDLYEDRLAQSNYSEDDFINLILIYWNISFDYGTESYCVSHNFFSEKEISKLPLRVEELFKIALQEYPRNLELLFWKIYIDEMILYSPGLYKDRMVDLLKKQEFLLPYFYLYVQCNEQNNLKLVELKKQLMNEDSNYKKMYILSYLDNV
ncbi:hypothetical protein [Flavobacterium sp. '19STA2R22 D10 B1']|uniref:hypothetical protein n=1 Tax=Flavobacterium aerium TaxID=3037261 RepID=UPI00278BF23E|nr:hypothetical protein [Flavobacterium sp. '19STA2R22 D10 B1']